MSASERLRELEAVTSTWPSGFSMSRMEATGRVLAALPEIVAVVGAAELLVAEARETHNPEYPNRLKSYYAAVPALAALEEKLKP